MNPKINAFFVIFLLLFSMFPIPIASAEFIDEINTIYQGKNFMGTIPSAANTNQGYKFQIEDDLISWSIDSITTRTDVFGKVKEDKVGASSLVPSTSTYVDATPLFKSDIAFDFTDNSMKQTVIIEKSDIDAQPTYTYLTIDETILTTKGAENYYININASEKISWTLNDKTDKDNIQAKELYFGNERLRLLEPIAYDENGNSINGYYDVIASNNHNFDVKTVFLKSDIDTLNGTIYFDPTIENGFTGYTTQTYSSLSGNQSIPVPNGTSYDLNITNNQEGVYSINGYDWNYSLLYNQNTSAAFTSTQYEINNTNFPINSTVFNHIETDGGGLPIMNFTYPNGTNIPFYVITWNSESDFELYTKTTSGIENLSCNLYYNGNSGLSSGSSITDTMDYGTEFNDLTGWTTTGTPIISSGSAEMSENDAIESTTTFNGPYIVEARSKMNQQDGLLLRMVNGGDVSDILNDDASVYDMNGDLTAIIWRYHDGTNYWSKNTGTPTIVNYQTYKQVHDGSSIDFYQDDVWLGNKAHTLGDGASIRFGVWDVSQESTLNVDLVFVRKYTTTILTYTISTEQQAQGATNITASVTGDNNTQNYNTSQSREFTLTPTGSTNDVTINTTSADYDTTLTTYWQEDTTEISQEDSQGNSLIQINYTPSFNISSGIINATFDSPPFGSVDSVDSLYVTHDGANISSNASRTGQEVNVSIVNLIADQNYLFNFSINHNTNMTASVSNQTFSTTQDVIVQFNASDVDSNPLTISGTLNGTTKTTTSPHNFGLMDAGSYTYYLNVTEDATISPHTENITATIEVIQNYGSVPSIHDGVYGYHYDIMPSESQILSRQTDGSVTVDLPVDLDNLNSTVWNTTLSRISYAYDNNIRTSLFLDVDGNYISQAYIDTTKTQIDTYLSDLTGDPYQLNTQFLTLNFTNTSASENDKVTFANTIGINISDTTNSKFKTVTREQLTGLDSTWIDNTPIKYIDLTTKSQWIDDEAANYRNSTTKSRMYTGNTSFFDDITTYRNTQLMKARGSSDVGNQFDEVSTVKLTNGDLIFYNNNSSTQNMTIQNVDNGTYFDINNDVYFNLTSNGEIYFNVGAESIIYVIKDTFSKIIFEDNSTSELVSVNSDNDNIIDYGNTLNETVNDSWLWGGADSDLKVEFYDPYYTEDNTFMIHYEWMNASVITDYSPYDYIIIADQNADEINNSLTSLDNVYEYIAVSDYADNQAWYDAKIAEISAIIDTYDTNIFIDGIDYEVSATNFSSRFKDVVDFIRVTKNKEAIVNTYTAYKNFSAYGDMVMKESAFSRWDGAVGSPTYSYENMTIEKERADFYTSQNIPVLGMSFGAVDDYEKQAFTSFAFAVLYGFDGENSWRYGQPNFQSQKELSIYPFGTMLEDTYTEHSTTDWSRLYDAGRVHINPVNHTYSIDDNLYVNSIKFNMSLHSGGAGAGDRNVYIYVNDNETPYTIPYNAGVDPLFTWTDKQLEISTSDYTTTGHYNIFAYTLRTGSGGWNSIGERDLDGTGTHTWYDETTENIPDTYANQTWNPLQSDRNFMVSFATNVTTSVVLDDIENIISQSDTNLTYNTTTVIESTKNYDIPFWSNTVTITESFTNASTYFKAQNGTWVEASVNTVTDIASSTLNWAYTTIDNKVYGVAKQVVSATEFIYKYLFPSLASTQEVYTETLPTIQNLTSTPDTDHIHFDWDDYGGADYYNISRMVPNVPVTSDIIILDGVKDDAFTNDAHTWIGDSPNPYTEFGKEEISWVRNDTTLSGYADGEDNDNFNNDDSFELFLDFNNDNLTTVDRIFGLKEDGSTYAKRWGGSSWLPQATNAVGIVIGGGTAGAIQYELQIPISELTNFTNGNTFKFGMKRECTGTNPDVQSFYPQTLINDTDATLWDEMTLSETTQYEFIGNTTLSNYEVENLTEFNWYKHKFTAINGIDESEPIYSIDTTEDLPSYSISGYVKDILGNPLENVELWAQNGFVSEVNTSNSSGYYSGSHFHNGSYTIYGNLSGYIINSTPITVAGVNLTNINLTLLVSTQQINVTNLTASPITIKEGQTSTITVDANETAGSIQSVTVTIGDSTYLMSSTTGDTWSYTWTAPQNAPHKYFITQVAATGQYSTNTTIQSAYIDVIASTGTGGAGGFGLPDEPPVDIVNDTITAIEDIEPIIEDTAESTIQVITNTTKTYINILKGDTVGFVGVKYTVGSMVLTKELIKPGSLMCEATDPQITCGAMDGVITLIITPNVDDSKFYQVIESHIVITNNDGTTKHVPVSITILNLLWYVDFNIDLGLSNPYIVEQDASTGTMTGLRLWWIGLILGLLFFGLNRKYGGE